MCPVYVCVCELVGVTKAKVDMRLRGEVEDCVDFVLTENLLHVRRQRYITLLKRKVCATIQNAGVVERCAVVELVKRDDIVVVRIGEGQVTDKLASTVGCQSYGVWEAMTMQSRFDIHEACSSCDENVPCVAQRLKFGGAGENRRLFPQIIREIRPRIQNCRVPSACHTQLACSLQCSVMRRDNVRLPPLAASGAWSEPSMADIVTDVASAESACKELSERCCTS